MTPMVQAAAISEAPAARFKRLGKLILKQTWANLRRRLPRALVQAVLFTAALTVLNFLVIAFKNNGIAKAAPVDQSIGLFQPPSGSYLGFLRNPLVGGFFGGVFLSIVMTVGMNAWRTIRKKGLAAAMQEIEEVPNRIQRYFRESNKTAWSNLLAGAGMAMVAAVLLGKYASLAVALGMGSLLMSGARQGFSTLMSSAWEATYGAAKGGAGKDFALESGYVVMAGSSLGFLLRAFVGGLYPASKSVLTSLVIGAALLVLALIAATAGSKAAAAAAALISLPFLFELLTRIGPLLADDRGFKEFGGSLREYLRSVDARIVLKESFRQGAGTGAWTSLLGQTWKSMLDSVPRDGGSGGGSGERREPPLLDENGNPMEKNSDGKYRWETSDGIRWVSREEAEELVAEELKSRSDREQEFKEAVKDGQRQSDEWLKRKGEEGRRSEIEMEIRKAEEAARAKAEQQTRDHMVERLKKMAGEKGGDFAEEVNKLLADGNYEGLRDFYRDKLGHQIKEGQEEAARELTKAALYKAGEMGSKFIVAASKSALVTLGTGGGGILATAIATGAISAAGDGAESYIQGDSAALMAGKTLVGFLSGAKDGAIGVYTNLPGVNLTTKLLLPAGADAVETYIRLNMAAIGQKNPEGQLMMLLRATGDGMLSLAGNVLNTKIQNIKGAFTREAADAAADMIKGGLSSVVKGGKFEDGFYDAFVSHLGGKIGSETTKTYVHIKPGGGPESEVTFGRKSDESETVRIGPGDDEPRGIGADEEPKRIGMDDEPRRIGADDEPKRIGADDEPRRIGADEEPRRIGMDEEPRRLEPGEEALRITGKNQREVDLDDEHLRNVAEAERRRESYNNSDPDDPAQRAKATIDMLENYQAKRMMKDETLPPEVRRQWASDVAEYRDKPLFKELADQCNRRNIMYVDWQTGSMRPVTAEDFGRVSSGHGPGMDIDICHRGDFVDADSLKPVKLKTFQEATSDACKALNFDEDKQGIHYGGGEKGSQDPEAFPVKPGSTARRMFSEDQLRRWDGADGEQARQVTDYKVAKAPQTLGAADGLSEQCRETMKNFDRIAERQREIHGGARIPEKWSPEAINIIRRVGNGDLPPGTGNEMFRQLTKGDNLEDGIRRLNVLQESVIKLDPDADWRAGRVPTPAPPKPRGPEPDLSTYVKGDQALTDRIQQQKRLEEQLARGEKPEDMPAGRIKTREELTEADRREGIRRDHPVLDGHMEQMEELRKDPAFREAEERVRRAEREAQTERMTELIEEKKEYLRRVHKYAPDDPNLQKEAEYLADHDQAGFAQYLSKVEAKLEAQDGATGQEFERYARGLRGLNSEPQAETPGRISEPAPPGPPSPDEPSGPPAPLASERPEAGRIDFAAAEAAPEPSPAAQAAPSRPATAPPQVEAQAPPAPSAPRRFEPPPQPRIPSPISETRDIQGAGESPAGAGAQQPGAGFSDSMDKDAIGVGRAAATEGFSGPQAASRLQSAGMRSPSAMAGASRLESAGLSSATTMGEAAHAEPLSQGLTSAGDLESGGLSTLETGWRPLEGATALDSQELEAARLEWEKIKRVREEMSGFKLPDDESR